MKSTPVKLVLGAALIIAAVFLARNPAYTAVKSAVADTGAPIGLAAAAAIGLVVLALAGGIALVRRA